MGLVLALALSVLPLILSTSPESASRRAFECGFENICHLRAPFSAKFFIISILFLIFDVEVRLLIPVLRLARLTVWRPRLILYLGLVLIVLLLGALYELSTGLLDWE